VRIPKHWEQGFFPAFDATFFVRRPPLAPWLTHDYRSAIRAITA
jgi:hypothetical protein